MNCHKILNRLLKNRSNCRKSVLHFLEVALKVWKGIPLYLEYLKNLNESFLRQAFLDAEPAEGSHTKYPK